MSKLSKQFQALVFFLLIFSLVVSNRDYSTSRKFDGQKGETGFDYVLQNQSDYDESEDVIEKILRDTPVRKLNRSVEKAKMKHVCNYYKNGEIVDLDKMADVWEAVYYQLPEDIVCFRIYIKRTTEKEREEYSLKYGNFGNSVDWGKCLLEIKSSTAELQDRRHFLMGDANSTKGVFDNVVITEWSKRNGQEHPGNGFLKREATTYYRTNDGPDQWRVVHDLLLMRDCHEGHIVVFSRYPRQHRAEDIYDALTVFGESGMEGKMACEAGTPEMKIYLSD